MCGIVGVFGKLSPKAVKAFEALLIVNQFRGKDSTGIFTVDKKGLVEVAKEAGDPCVLMDTNRYQEVLGKPDERVCLVGHGRYATGGTPKTRKNSHPFEFENVVGVHNGMFNKYSAGLKYSQAYDVDSEVFYANLNESNIEETISKFQYGKNAFSLVWYDKVSQTLQFLRNSERPMNMVVAKDGFTLFASDPLYLEFAVAVAGIEVASDITETSEDHLLTFDILSKNIKPKIRKINVPKPYTPPANLTGGNRITLVSGGSNPKKSAFPVIGGVVEVELIEVKSWFGGLCAIFMHESTDLDFWMPIINSSNKAILEGLVGEAFEVEIVNKRKFNNVDQYVVNTLTWRHIEKVKEEPLQLDYNDSGARYKDGKGNYLSRESWLKKHSDCCICSSPVFPEDDTHEFDNSGNNIICGDCASSFDKTLTGV